MKSSGEAKLLIILGLIVLLGGGTLVAMNGMQNPPTAAPTAPPSPPPFNMTAETFDKLLAASKHIKGDAKAPITIIEFADFECPSCRRAYNNTLKELLKTKPIRFAFHHYPLPNHQNAMPAALAMESAAKQGKAWEMYDQLFEGEMVELSPDYIKTLAKNVKLDMDQFDKDMANSQTAAPVQADKILADEYKVDMTPTFFIRDKEGKFHRAIGADDFAKQIAPLLP
jgi:protein-disulfide isomerase